MYFPSLFAMLFAGQTPRGYHALRRWLPALVLALAGLLGSGATQAAVFNFDGKPAGDCTLTGKEYSCPASFAVKGNDEINIASGYTLKLNSSFAFGWNQRLVMRAGSRLVCTGSFSLADLNPTRLDVTGGSFVVGGTFYMGSSAQSMTADVSANAIQLGGAQVTITGNLAAQGTISISSGSKITGNVSGASVTTSSSTTITGNVSAGSRFTLASGSTVSGSVTAPVFDMLSTKSTVNGNISATTSFTMGSENTVIGNVATGVFDMQASSSRIKGNVTATTRMTMASGNTVDGNVDTGDLLLQSSNALITGNARVNWATLEWAGRVAGIIYCKNGTAAGRCDCVTNNSGSPVNSANGPRCEAVAAQGPHHFQIAHDGSGDTCIPEQVTVTACANAACTAYYTGGASGKLDPFGADFTIAPGQSAVQLSVNRTGAGTVVLGVSNPSVAPQSGATCYNTTAQAANCAIVFTGGVKLRMTVPHHLAGNEVQAAIAAVKANPQETACVPAFANAIRNVYYACSYSKPASGTEDLTLGGLPLACGGAKPVTTRFTNGVASLTLRYPDAGEVALTATMNDDAGGAIAGSTRFTVAPAGFRLSAPAAPLRAGANVDIVVEALNAAGAPTRNFDTAKLNLAGATQHAVAVDIDCRAQAGMPGAFAVQGGSFTNGAARFATSWSEVGRIDIRASLKDFLGIEDLDASGSTNTSSLPCAGKVGPFIPHYFKVELADKERAFYYAKEPFTLKVSAMNKNGELTWNYGAGLSEDLTLAANDGAGTAFATAPGSLSGGAIAASQFSNGVATVAPSYAFAAMLTRPTRIRLRATNGKAGASLVSSNHAAAADAETGAVPEIRSGRLRIANAFGSRGSKLSLPVMAEYWTGNSWMLNTDDNYTSIPLDAFSIRSTEQASAPATAAPFKVSAAGSGSLQLAKGMKPLHVQEASGRAGWGDVTVNLGTAAAALSCLGNVPGSKAAALEWLRAPNACRTDQPLLDPSARATFGVFAPETRRIIHVREVFR